jgi:ribosomal protein S18 acetylase RimI-like enzyme
VPDSPTSTGRIRIAPANLDDDRDASAVHALLCEFAREPVSGGKDLPEDVQARLIEGLRAHPVSRNWIAWDDSTAPSTPVGCAICQIGFSTFIARPTLNLHDLFVLPSHRDRGVGGLLMDTLHRAAEALGCGKVTLEVARENVAGQRFYRRLGYGDGKDPDGGDGVWFWSRRT